jgi:uncharacterized membrane protein YgcG
MKLHMGARHAAVALAVIVLAGLTGFGCVGPAVGVERIHAYETTAIIREDRTVLVREVIDWDFAGGLDRHGIFREIPYGGGVPQDITVESPDAPDEFTTTDLGTHVEVKIGDPDQTVSGRHRYVITYVLPATIQGDRFALNAIGTDFPVPIESATVAVLGGDLDDPGCFMGVYGSTDECDLTVTDGDLEVALTDLEANEGITIDGDLVGTRPAELPDLPPFEERDQGARLTWALIVLGIGAVVGVTVFVVCRQIGRNEVAAGGATEAAFVPYGQETFGPDHTRPDEPPPPLPGSRRVADSEMGELAGLEFVPPGGVEPWQASAVLRETIDDRTIGAWFSGLAAHDILAIEGAGAGAVTLTPGPKATSADPTSASILNTAMAGGHSITLGSYNPTFATAWKQAGHSVDAWVRTSHVFRRRPPTYGSAGLSGAGVIMCIVWAAVLVGGGGLVSLAGSSARTAWAAVLLAILVPLAVGMVAYSRLTRSLTARGSAIALRTESFRRFLHDSEAQHVEWAWQNGLLRDYSAWAVALGEADAWNDAMSASSVPAFEQDTTRGIMAPAIYSSSFHSTTTAPSSSGSGGGGGGFSGGGFSGGGGGGGGGGSW